MITKISMTSSSVFLGLSGALLSFLPDEILSHLEIIPNPISTLSLQLLGSTYLGFAMLNWMAKGATIGGIYNKPIAIGNLMHFGVGALALIKVGSSIQQHSAVFVALAVVYAIFALLFGYIFRTNPSKIA